jgi:hypothetical protein
MALRNAILSSNPKHIETREGEETSIKFTDGPQPDGELARFGQATSGVLQHLSEAEDFGGTHRKVDAHSRPAQSADLPWPFSRPVFLQHTAKPHHFGGAVKLDQ